MIEDIYSDETLFVGLNQFRHNAKALCKDARRVSEHMTSFEMTLLGLGISSLTLWHRWDDEQSRAENGLVICGIVGERITPTTDTIILAGGDSTRSLSAAAAALLVAGQRVTVVEDLLTDRRAEAKKRKPADWHAEKVRRRTSKALFAAGKSDAMRKFDVMTRAELVARIADEARRPDPDDTPTRSHDFRP